MGSGTNSSQYNRVQRRNSYNLGPRDHWKCFNSLRSLLREFQGIDIHILKRSDLVSNQMKKHKKSL